MSDESLSPTKPVNLRLLQLRGEKERSLLAADGRSARIVNGVRSTRELASLALETGVGLAEMISRLGLGQEVDPAAELAAGRIMAPIDHEDPAHLLMSGTGLTHLVEYKDCERRHALPLFFAKRIVEWLPRLGELIQIG